MLQDSGCSFIYDLTKGLTTYREDDEGEDRPMNHRRINADVSRHESAHDA